VAVGRWLLAGWHALGCVMLDEAMNLTIDLSEQNAAALEAQARAARMPAERYLADIVARALDRQRRRHAENLGKHLDAMAAQVAPETTSEEMDAALQEALTQIRPGHRWRP
jgi:hypothetical protein